MTHPSARGGEIVIKTIVVHTVTYFIVGVLAFFLLDYPALISQSRVSVLMRPLDHPLLMAGPLLQPLRGFLFGLVFYLLREPFFGAGMGGC